jgi:CRISPR/Cas system-associated endonuclease Cas3-HD
VHFFRTDAPKFVQESIANKLNSHDALVAALGRISELERRAVNIDYHVAGRAATYAGLLEDIGKTAIAALAQVGGGK